jgi:hypothetical protein
LCRSTGPRNTEWSLEFVLTTRVKDHPFVQKVEHIKNHILSIILYGEEQMVDFQHILKTVESPRVGIDRTFNLGSFYVTAFVYKNHRVVKTNSNDHSVFLGPVLLHKEASYKVFHDCLSHVNARIWFLMCSTFCTNG